jgi:hypothetical protein
MRTVSRTGFSCSSPAKERLQTFASTIKVRNYSNFNQIFSNTFWRTGLTAFFSDAPSAGECSSWRNEFRYNTLRCGYSGSAIKTFKDQPQLNLPRGQQGPACPVLPEWLYTSGNQNVCP